MESSIQDKKVGSAMVVGGGIGGIQTALDLADSGFKVYLLENAPAIGGTMSQLDKTFPTGDCSMCMISPKLVECGRHLNIKLITYADVEGVSGSACNFKVRVKRRARYVDESKCNGCGDCENACPVDIENNFDEGLADRKAIYRLYPQAFPNVYTITKRGTSPCRLTCPAGINAQGYVALIAQGKFDKALELIRETTPFPGVLGRVCTHPCEGECERGKVDESIAICALKRFAADCERTKPSSEIPNPKSQIPNPNSPKVAVIGGGPAGLTAAYHLNKMGYTVTVFERFSVAGGMLKLGIPNFRLPKDIVDYEIETIRKSGVEIRTNTIIGKDISFEELRKDYKSIFIAIGAIESGRLRIEGENLKGVFNALDFLAAVNLDQKVEIGRHVVVVGGGNTALDSARTSLRLGAETVRIIYRRSEEEMPALPREIAEALEEGIRIDYLIAPKRILGQTSQVIGLECTYMQLGETDKSGRRKSVPIAGSEFNIDADTVILAINRYADLSFLPKEITVAPDGNLVADSETLATNLPGIFAGGDVVSGPDILVKAIAAGKEAAISIDRYLKGLDPKEGRPKKLLATKDEELIRKERVERQKRQIMPVRAIKERIRSFREIELGFDEVTAREEARRCLSCGGCSECLECVKVCKP
ncbi:MAG: FAD-dependent oxidoreductase, partial [Planctomycetota bacterium]|nr:FAD-dependent oxidoreductase [Planctomycetota bacterium]